MTLSVGLTPDSLLRAPIFFFRKYLIPDSNDEIRQEQMREMELIAVGTGDTITAAGMAGITSPSGEISLRTKLGCHVLFQVAFILHYRL